MAVWRCGRQQALLPSAALLLASLVCLTAADRAPDGTVWFCMFRSAACEFRNETTITCSLLALNGTCSTFLDGAVSARVRRTNDGPSVSSAELLSFDGFLDNACSPPFAFPFGITNLTLSQCRPTPLGFSGAFFNDCPECKNIVRRYPCNPTKCVTGITCTNSTACGGVLDWNFCSAKEPEKFSRRQYCAKGWYMCDEGGILPAGSCEASPALCDFKVRYSNELCDEIDSYWMCVHPSGTKCQKSSPRHCKLIRNGDCIPFFPGSIAPSQTADKKWQVRGTWDAFCGAPFFQDNGWILSNLTEGTCGHYEYPQLSPALARDIVFYKEKNCADCAADSVTDSLGLFEPSRAKIASTNCAAKKTRLACDSSDGLCMWTGLPHFSCETTPTGVFLNSLSQVCLASVSEKECNFLYQCSWNSNGQCRPPDANDITLTTIVMQINADQASIGSSIIDSSYQARHGEPVGLNDCNLIHGISGRGALLFQGVDMVRFPSWDLDPPDTSTNKIVQLEFLISLWMRPEKNALIDITSPSAAIDGTVNQRFLIGPSSQNHSLSIIQRADPLDAKKHHIFALSVGSNGLAIYGYNPRGPVPGMVRVLSYAPPAPFVDWTHVSIYQQSGAWSLYINNTLVLQTVSDISVVVLPGSLGGHEYGYYRGALDFLTIWNMERRSLTTDALSQILNLLSNSDNDVTCTLQYTLGSTADSSSLSPLQFPSSQPSFPSSTPSFLGAFFFANGTSVNTVTSQGGLLQPLVPVIDAAFDLFLNEPFSFLVAEGALPPGVTIDPNTGRISGSPTASGNFSALVRVSGKEFPICSAELRVNIMVNPPVNFTITSPLLPNPSATEDSSFSTPIPIVARGGSGVYSFALEGNSLSVGLKIASSTDKIPVLSGTPFQQGVFDVVVRITDSFGSSITVTPPFKVTVFPRIALLGDDSFATLGGLITVTPFEVGGGEPFPGDRKYVYRIDSAYDALPQGMTLDPSGKFTGIPRQSGNFSIVVEVIDANNASVSVLTRLFVAPEIVIRSSLDLGVALATFQNSDLAELTIPEFVVTGGRSPYTWQLLQHPGGLELKGSGSRATLSGIITQQGTFNPIVRVTDKNGAAKDATFLLKVIPSRDTKPQADGTSSKLVIGVASAAAIVVLMSALFVALILRRRTKKPIGPYTFQQELSPESLALYLRHAFKSPLIPTEIPRKDLVLPSEPKVLGSGAYGKVSLAVLKEAREIKVAVKTNLPGSENEEDIKFEAAIGTQFDHPNLVALVGVVTLGEQFMIVMEYCKHGSLLELLQKNGPESSLSLTTILKIGCDVLSGLEYLEKLGFIHRDIAARNILVNDRYVCKIADFGMCRRLARATSSYQTENSTTKVPIRWMAPESICYGNWSHASDMWSFGVLMYECFTSGRIPYHELPNEQATGLGIVNYLSSGNRLFLRDAECPPSIYGSIILPCWIMAADKRPRAHALRKVVERCISMAFEALNKEDEDQGSESEEESESGSGSDSESESGSGSGSGSEGTELDSFNEAGIFKDDHGRRPGKRALDTRPPIPVVHSNPYQANVSDQPSHPGMGSRPLSEMILERQQMQGQAQIPRSMQQQSQQPYGPQPGANNFQRKPMGGLGALPPMMRFSPYTVSVSGPSSHGGSQMEGSSGYVTSMHSNAVQSSTGSSIPNNSSGGSSNFSGDYHALASASSAALPPSPRARVQGPPYVQNVIVGPPRQVVPVHGMNPYVGGMPGSGPIKTHGGSPTSNYLGAVPPHAIAPSYPAPGSHATERDQGAPFHLDMMANPYPAPFPTDMGPTYIGMQDVHNHDLRPGVAFPVPPNHNRTPQSAEDYISEDKDLPLPEQQATRVKSFDGVVGESIL